MKAKRRDASLVSARARGLLSGFAVAKHEQDGRSTGEHYQPYARGPEATAWLAGFEQGYLSGWEGNYCPNTLDQDPIDYQAVADHSDRYID